MRVSVSGLRGGSEAYGSRRRIRKNDSVTSLSRRLISTYLRCAACKQFLVILFPPSQVGFSCTGVQCTLVRRSHTFSVASSRQRYVDQLVTALLLFRLGSVSVPRYDYHAESFSPFANGSFRGQQRAPGLVYTLSADDRPSLMRGTAGAHASSSEYV